MNKYIYVITVDSVVYASFDNMKAMQEYADFFFDADEYHIHTVLLQSSFANSCEMLLHTTVEKLTQEYKDKVAKILNKKVKGQQTNAQFVVDYKLFLKGT